MNDKEDYRRKLLESLERDPPEPDFGSDDKLPREVYRGDVPEWRPDESSE